MFVKQSAKYKKLRKYFQYCTQHRTIATTDGSGDTVEDVILSIKKFLKQLFSGILIIKVRVTVKSVFLKLTLINLCISIKEGHL